MSTGSHPNLLSGSQQDASPSSSKWFDTQRILQPESSAALFFFFLFRDPTKLLICGTNWKALMTVPLPSSCHRGACRGPAALWSRVTDAREGSETLFPLEGSVGSRHGTDGPSPVPPYAGLRTSTRVQTPSLPKSLTALLPPPPPGGWHFQRSFHYKGCQKDEPGMAEFRL